MLLIRLWMEPDVPNINYIARAANRMRQNQRPADPKDVNFQLSEDHVPSGFFRKIVKAGDRRHLIFFRSHQAQMLKTARRWYLDGTFKVMRKPFPIVFTIHAFVRHGDSAKQLPLAFVFMSGRTTYFVDLLHRKAALARLQVTMVYEQKLRCYQRNCYATLQGKIMKLWELYRNGEVSTSGFLRRMSVLVKPTITIRA